MYYELRLGECFCQIEAVIQDKVATVMVELSTFKQLVVNQNVQNLYKLTPHCNFLIDGSHVQDLYTNKTIVNWENLDV